MQNSRALLIVALFLASSGAACGRATSAEAVAQSTAGTQTVTGRVVCLVCYARNTSNNGADHDTGRMCAHACIRWEGNPAGVVTADGKVYQLAGGVVTNNNAKIIPHIAQTVSVIGEVYEKDGMTMIRADDMRTAQK